MLVFVAVHQVGELSNQYQNDLEQLYKLRQLLGKVIN